MADIAVTARSVRPLPGALIRPYTAGGAVAPGDAVYLDSTGKVQRGNAAAVGTAKAFGIVVAVGTLGAVSGASGDVVDVLLSGKVNGYSGMTIGAKVYVSAATAGRLADAAPSAAGNVAWIMGIADAADTVLVEPLAPNPQAAIADPSGGATIDTQARTAINSLIAALEAHGILAN